MARRLSEEFHHLAAFCKGKQLTLKELIEKISPRTRALVTFVLSLPFVLFIAPPGLSVVFGVFIFFNGMRIAMSEKLWFPRFLLRRKLSGTKLSHNFLHAEKVAKWAEKFIRPRGRFLAKHPHLQILHGAILVICGFLLALPLPPGTNFTPGLTTALISLGILEEDGVFIIFGYLAFVLNLAFFILIPLYGIDPLFRLWESL